MIAERVAEVGPGEWIRAINYNQLKLEERRRITREELDEAAPDNPVIVTRLTGARAGCSRMCSTWILSWRSFRDWPCARGTA